MNKVQNANCFSEKLIGQVLHDCIHVCKLNIDVTACTWIYSNVCGWLVGYSTWDRVINMCLLHVLMVVNKVRKTVRK